MCHSCRCPGGFGGIVRHFGDRALIAHPATLPTGSGDHSNQHPGSPGKTSFGTLTISDRIVCEFSGPAGRSGNLKTDCRCMAPTAFRKLLVLSGDAVFDSRLPRLVDDQDSSIALVDSGVSQLLEPLVAAAPNTKWGKLCSLALIQRDWAADQDLTFAEALGKGLEEKTITPLDVAAQDLYSTTMRRELPAYWFPAPSVTNKPASRTARNFRLGQKGTLDFPALLHGPIETFIVARLCKTSIFPISSPSGNIAAWTATVLFATGQLVWGTALALIVGVLDGLDGKQARVKIETSEVGKLEHWLDTLF